VVPHNEVLDFHSIASCTEARLLSLETTRNPHFSKPNTTTVYVGGEKKKGIFPLFKKFSSIPKIKNILPEAYL
jgi:hypothetical protein